MSKIRIELSPFDVISIREGKGITPQKYVKGDKSNHQEPIDYTIKKIAEGMLPEKGSLYWRN